MHAPSQPATAVPLRPSMTRQSTMIVAVLTVAGLLLRIFGARGDLWVDEIWTLTLLKPVASLGEIFWAINHDNNHYLNTLWLYLVGLEADVLVMRAASIALGVATIVMAAVIAHRNGRIAAIAAAALFSLSYAMVHYGSEARGYAGLVLFSLSAIYCAEQSLERGGFAWRIGLALSFVLGLLSHVLMALTVFVVGSWAIAAAWQRTRSVSKTIALVLSTFALTALSIVAMLAMLYAVWRSHSFTTGGLFPFEPEKFVESYAKMISLLAGLPAGTPSFLAIAAAVVVVALVAYLSAPEGRSRAWLYCLGVIALPVLMFVAEMPNSEFSRYFLVSGCVLLLALADLFALAWRRGGTLRVAAVGLALLAFAGNLNSLAHFFEAGRGHYREAVAAMAGEGPFSFSGSQDLRVAMLGEYYAEKLGVSARYVARKEICAGQPGWLVVEKPEEFETRVGRYLADCRARFVAVGTFPQWGLSGTPWTLYRRAE